MKPLQKVVTAPDVESCLYYIHLNSADDEKLLEESFAGADYCTPKVAEQPAQNQTADTVKRKPLPAHPHVGFDDRTGLSTGSYPHAQLPIRSHEVKATPAQQSTGLKGPRPMQPRLHTTGDPTLKPFFGPTYTEQAASARRKSEQLAMRAPELLRRQVQPESPKPMNPNILGSHAGPGEFKAKRDTDSFNQHARPNLMPVSNSEIPVTSCNSDFSLTIIRRYNSLQANVGKVEHHTEHHSSDTVYPATNGQSLPKPSNAKTSIEILTPGYLKFDHNAISIKSDQHGKAASQRQSVMNNHVLHDEDGREPAKKFQRQLQPLPNRKRPQQQHPLESDDSYLGGPALRSSDDFRQPGQQSSEESGFKRLSPSLPPSPAQYTRNFAFESPWHGLCEFSTGIAGRSLKCKHTLGSSSDTISELRFNLPSSKAFGASPRSQSSSDTTRDSKRSSIFSHHGRTHSASEHPGHQAHEGKVELEDRLDLSLGRERAGGGFGGKQAKLGKLVIENEGLKMLDLLVAANIALWWKVYEKAA